MTSKNYFSRCMKHDLSHKKWLLILTFVLQMSTVLVGLLFFLQLSDERGISYGYTVVDGKYARFAMDVLRFFTTYNCLLNGFLAGGLALLSALYSFRYLMNRRLQDTYESLPIGRMQQFFMVYVDGMVGFVISCILSFLVALPISLSAIAREKSLVPAAVWQIYEKKNLTYVFEPGRNVTAVLQGFAAVLLVYLLVYHLTILAMVLTGNYLNTIIMMAIIGLLPGVFAGESIAFQFLFRKTFYLMSGEDIHFLYLSPLMQPITFLINEPEIPDLVVSLITVVLMLVLASFVYRHRKSEAAHKGLEHPCVSRVLQVLTTIGVASAGYIIMCGMTRVAFGEGYRHGFVWNFLALMVAGILCFAILNMIFEMDPKSAFKHKGYLVVSMLLALTICRAYEMDVFGYDKYLPKEEEILSMEIWDYEMVNGNVGYSREEYGMGAEITDNRAIYAFLKRMIENEEFAWDKDFLYNIFYSEYVVVKLKNGKTYSRAYRSTVADRDVKEPIFSSKEYTEKILKADVDRAVEHADYVNIYQEYNNKYIEMLEDSKELAPFTHDILLAYNKDIDEHPKELWNPETKALCTINVTGNGIRDDEGIYFDGNAISIVVREGMTNVMEVLRAYGYGEFLELPSLEEGDSLNIFFATYDYEDTYSLIRKLSQGDFTECTAASDGVNVYTDQFEDFTEVHLIITDPNLLKQLEKYICYHDGYYFAGMKNEYGTNCTVYTGLVSYETVLGAHALPPEVARTIWDSVQK